MKKTMIICALLLVISMTANAQLGSPTTTVKDTFQITEIVYNGAKLNKADWPATFIAEDALNIYISKYVYVKGKGHLVTIIDKDYEYVATCNGENTKIYVKRPKSYGSYTTSGTYIIGDYNITVQMRENVSVEPVKDSSTQINSSVLYQRKKSGASVGGNLGEYPSTKGQFSVAGRSAVSLPTPRYVSTSAAQGKVVVKIWVDRSGKVTKVTTPEKGSTINNNLLINAAKEAALKARFNADESAPEIQIGTISYFFKID